MSIIYPHKNNLMSIIYPFVCFLSKTTATKATHIHCRENKTVYREQLYILGGMCGARREESVFIRPEKKKDECVIVLIKGKPGSITGLDENGFVSSRGVLKKDTDIYVMSEAAFKLF